MRSKVYYIQESDLLFIVHPEKVPGGDGYIIEFGEDGYYGDSEEYLNLHDWIYLGEL